MSIRVQLLFTKVYRIFEDFQLTFIEWCWDLRRALEVGCLNAVLLGTAPKHPPAQSPPPQTLPHPATPPTPIPPLLDETEDTP